MEALKILNSDLIDLIFDGRNKDYGAYQLRKTYSKRYWIALGLTCATILMGEGVLLVIKRNHKEDSNYVVREVTPSIYAPKELPILKIPKVPPQAKVEIKRFTR